jgi:hypothetical protein
MLNTSMGIRFFLPVRLAVCAACFTFAAHGGTLSLVAFEAQVVGGPLVSSRVIRYAVRGRLELRRLRLRRHFRDSITVAALLEYVYVRILSIGGSSQEAARVERCHTMKLSLTSRSLPEYSPVQKKDNRGGRESPARPAT